MVTTSSCSKVTHTILEKYTCQNKNMARRNGCMSCDSFEIFVSGLVSSPPHPCINKEFDL